MIIKDFFKLYATNDNISTDKLVQMVEEGLLRINDKQLIYSLEEVAQITNRSRRAVYHWVQSGKLNTILFNDINYVKSEDLQKFLDLLPIPKNKTCIYVRGKNIDEINALVTKTIEEIGVNKYRTSVYVDIDNNTDGLKDLFKFMLDFKNIVVYSNVDFMQDSIAKIVFETTGSQLKTI